MRRLTISKPRVCGVFLKLAPLGVAVALSGSAAQSVELGTYPGGRQPSHQGISTRSQYLKMDDGVRLALDVLLPKDFAERKFPTIIRWTPNGRAARNAAPTALDLFFVEHGYARVLVDERGTGASFGVEKFGKRNLRDMSEVVDWIIRQSWSNGKIGAEGDSSDGRSAELFAAAGNPAVRAVATRYSDFDELSGSVMPGGILAEWLVNTKSDYSRKRNDVKFFKPVDEDRNGSLLKQAVRDHQANPDFSDLMGKIAYRDDFIPELGMTAGGIGVASERDAIQKSGVPFFIQAGWLDGASAASAIRRFNELQNSQRLVIGPWNHLGMFPSTLNSKEEISPLTTVQQWSELLSFFDRYLKEEKLPSGKQLFYYTLGEEKWKAASQWPPAGAVKRRLYFSPDFSLVSAMPTSGTVTYSANPDTSSGYANRWHTQVTPAVARYPSLDEGRLTFTSSALTEIVELTGTSSITLKIKSTTADAAFFAYLEILPSFGSPVYVTEGQLRALHRNGREFLKKDAAPLTPGEWTEITFDLLPHSVRVEKGARVRISLAGADKDTFERVGANANWNLDCGASFLDLATMERAASNPTVRVPAEDPDPLELRKWKGRFPVGNAFLEVVPAFDHLTVLQNGQEALEQTAHVKSGDRSRLAERNSIAKTIADALAKEDMGPLSRSVTLLLRPMTGSILGEWRSFTRQIGTIQSVEVMGTADYTEKNWAASFLLVRGTRGFRMFTLRWSGMKISGWGQDEGFPAIRDYYPAPDGTFVSPAKQNLPAARIRKVGEVVEFVH